MSFSDPDIGFILEVAKEAAKKILDIYREPFEVDYKKGKEPVTRADRVADSFFVEAITRAFPQDALLTEENGFVSPSGPPNGRVWFIDPIDGTKEFIKKNGEFAIQIGLAQNGTLIKGLILKPTSADYFIAVQGKGCFHRQNAEPWNRVQVPQRPSKTIIAAMSRSHPSSTAIKIGKQCGLTSILERGSVGLKLMAIAQGEAHFYLNDSNSTKAWDIAGPQILFTEAGGTVTDLQGNPFRYDPQNPFHQHGLLASCDQELHTSLLQKLREFKD